VHAVTETQVGKEIYQIEPPHRRPVDQVLALAAALQAAW